MSIKNVLALAAALIMSGAVGANAAGIGASVNVGPIGAHVGVGTPNLGYWGAPINSGFVAGPAAFPISDQLLTQPAVINGGVTAIGPMVGGNLTGTTQLPQGTLLVQGAPAWNTAIILPGMVGMPSQFACGANVQEIGASGPSALSLLGTSTPPIAELPGGVYTRSYQRITTKHVARRARKCSHRRVLRKCSHRRVIRRCNPAASGS